MFKWIWNNRGVKDIEIPPCVVSQLDVLNHLCIAKLLTYYI